ncbi:MAG: hypothetical protein ACK481_05755 [Candidatus Melainabacteria bacterium]|jgi:hypothetical protein
MFSWLKFKKKAPSQADYTITKSNPLLFEGKDSFGEDVRIVIDLRAGKQPPEGEELEKLQLNSRRYVFLKTNERTEYEKEIRSIESFFRDAGVYFINWDRIQ